MVEGMKIMLEFRHNAKLVYSILFLSLNQRYNLLLRLYIKIQSITLEGTCMQLCSLSVQSIIDEMFPYFSCIYEKMLLLLLATLVLISYINWQRIQYARTKSDIIAKKDGTFVPREKKKRHEEKGNIFSLWMIWVQQYSELLDIC